LCNSCASLAGLVLCFIACFILLVIGPLEHSAPVSVGQVDLSQEDESFDIPKPLVVALGELGPCTGPVIRILVEAGADVGIEAYLGMRN